MKPLAHPLALAPSIKGSPEVVGVHYDLSGLRIELQFSEPEMPIVVCFSRPVGFRVLDEGDLLEFWPGCSSSTEWAFLVKKGGWHDLESRRQGYLSQHNSEIHEVLIAGLNDCVSVLSNDMPTVSRQVARAPK